MTDETPRIGLLGSLVLCVNNLNGPGMLAIPILFQQAGALPTLVCLVYFFMVSALCSTMLCETVDIVERMATKHTHVHLGGPREFSNVVRLLYGDFWYAVAQWTFTISLQSINIASIIVCAQVDRSAPAQHHSDCVLWQTVDNILIFANGKTYAWQMFPSFAVVESSMSGDDIFGSGHIALSLGYVVLTLVFLPFGFLSLNQNIRIQYVSFLWTLFIIAVFIRHFVVRIQWLVETSELALLPVVGLDWSQLVGISTFTYSFTTLIPSWYLEKASSVNANTVIWISSAWATLCFVALGILASSAYPGEMKENVLAVMSGPRASAVTKVCVSVFALFSVAPSIAVRSIMIRLNMTLMPSQRSRTVSERVVAEDFCSPLASWWTCSSAWATFWGCIFPWLCSFIFYQGKGFTQLINWTSLTVNAAVCFIAPFFLYLKAIGLEDELDARQKTGTYEHTPLLAVVDKPPAVAWHGRTRALPCCRSKSSLPTVTTIVLLVTTSALLLAQIGWNTFIVADDGQPTSVGQHAFTAHSHLEPAVGDNAPT